MSNNIPKFDNFVCFGDSVEWQYKGFDLKATIEHDPDINTDDFDCYSKSDIDRYRNDEWHFGYLKVSASLGEKEFSAEYLGGIEVNFTDNNDYLSDCIKDYGLDDEVIEGAINSLKELIAKASDILEAA